MVLLVHNQSLVPTTFDGSINVKTGAETYVGVSRIFSQKLEGPYSDCIKSLKPFSAYSERIFTYFSRLNSTLYDQVLCLNLCYQDKLIDNCGCCSTITDTIRDAKYCQTVREISCEQMFDFNFSASDVNQVCENVCRQECRKEEYKLLTSQASFPSASYVRTWQAIFKNKLNKTLDLTELRRFADTSILRLIVNYEQQTYAVIDEKPAMSSEELLGQVKKSFQMYFKFFFNFIKKKPFIQGRREARLFHWIFNYQLFGNLGSCI